MSGPQDRLPNAVWEGGNWEGEGEEGEAEGEEKDQVGLKRKVSYTLFPKPNTQSCKEKKKLERACPGFEPGTSRTQSENHAPRPTSQPAGTISHYANEKDQVGLKRKVSYTLFPKPNTQSCKEKKKLERACPGFEPGTSRTQSENHAPRPTSQLAGTISHYANVSTTIATTVTTHSSVGGQTD